MIITKENVIEHHIHFAMRSLLKHSDYLDTFIHVQIAEEMLRHEMDRREITTGNAAWEAFFETPLWAEIRKASTRFYNWTKHNKRDDEAEYDIDFDLKQACYAGLSLNLIRFEAAFGRRVPSSVAFFEALIKLAPQAFAVEHVRQFLAELGIEAPGHDPA